jgi:hypothetical protein
MSKFVNYKKRTVTLPPGCKDLIDVLHRQQPRKPQGISPQELPTVTRGESGTVSLSEIHKYVAMSFASVSKSVLLMLSPPDERLTVDFQYIDRKLYYVSVVFEEDADREQLMREFFIGHQLEVPQEDWTPTQFVAGVPVQLIFRIRPLPSDAAAASQLTSALFRQVCQLSDNSELKFRYYEMTDA